jgi:hypothetical protein
MSGFNLSDYLVSHKSKSCLPMVPRIMCKDGFSLSVQCNSGSYCKPREDFSDFYWEVEVGFPSAAPDFIWQYAEDFDNPTDTVYPYVPVGLVEELILSHGGIS